MMNNNLNNNGTNNNRNNNSNNGGNFIMANNTINSLQVFAGIIKEAFTSVYPDNKVFVREVKKNNGLVLTGLTICERDINIAPTIYLDAYFAQYKDGRAMTDIIRAIDECYKANRVGSDFNIAGIMDFENVKDRVCFKLINKDRNAELLSDMPYIEFLDLAVTFYVLVSEDEMGTGSITIHNSLMEAWGTDKKELLKLAMHNTQRRFTGHVYNMMSIIESMMGRDAELDKEVRNCFYEMESVYEDDICPMYVATNSKKLNGACVMLYDGLLRDFARKTDRNFYIIPSSIHEVILIPDTLDMDIHYMKAMVKEVNGTEVSPDEVLSDNVYRYDIDTDRIEMM